MSEREHEEKWVKCEICGKGFDNYPALVAHLVEHVKGKKDEDYHRICKQLTTQLLDAISGKLDEILIGLADISLRLDILIETVEKK